MPSSDEMRQVHSIFSYLCRHIRTILESTNCRTLWIAQIQPHAIYISHLSKINLCTRICNKFISQQIWNWL